MAIKGRKLKMISANPIIIASKRGILMKFFLTILLSLLLASCIPVPGPIPPTTTIPKSTAISTPIFGFTSTPLPTNTPFLASDPVLVGAGDIAHCASDGDEATASLLDAIPGTVFTTGDNVYRSGTPEEFANCYDPSWGRHKARTYPSPGNHDYGTAGAAGYYAYFGPMAGEPGKGYYSYDLGEWHIIVLNSNIPVEPGSPQDLWLREDLAAHPVACTLAYWHHPRFSSGSVHGSNRRMQPLWEALYQFGADVVLAGHEHNYERFAPQTPQGDADPSRGIRQFVVGTGGRSYYSFETPITNSEVSNGDAHGVLKLTLHSGAYSWEFIPVAGETFTDSGTAPCVTP